jgi:hypothetical protein
MLTDAERQKFADYLEMDAEGCDQLAIQMEKLPSPPTLQLAKQQRNLAMAERVVARKLRSTETMTI